MTEYRQLIQANTSVEDVPYYGLRMTQSIFNAPVRHAWCWDAWLATEFKHVTDPLPDYPVPVWFYATAPYSGHKQIVGQSVVWVPSKQAFLSNPAYAGQSQGQQWFNTIEDIEKTFNAEYVGWSEDLNGLRIIEPITES